jgi:hypothetical protein
VLRHSVQAADRRADHDHVRRNPLHRNHRRSHSAHSWKAHQLGRGSINFTLSLKGCR